MEGSVSSAKDICSQDELDGLLYGYTKQSEESLPNREEKEEPASRTKLLSHGIERILEKKRPKFGAKLPVDLPEGMTVAGSCVTGAHGFGVFNSSASAISRGTRYGPYNGRLVTIDQFEARCDNNAMWEIYENGAVNHFVDGRRADGTRCWMSLVRCARHPNEQNLNAVQRENRIYYEASREIARGAELLVWYGEQYLQFMGVPVAIKYQAREINDPERRLNHEASDGFQCQRCGKVFAYRYYRDKHLKYTRCVDQGDRKFPCLLCSRSFEKKDRLRIHVLHVHEKHRPHKCSVCSKSFSQSSSLNKHMRVHSGERPYKCIYCSKAFTASSILRTHIRQHSGEKPFKCRHCGKAFASHAAHDSHVRRTHTSATGSTTCHLCLTEFARFQDLRKHCCSSKEPMFGSMKADDRSIDGINVVCSSSSSSSRRPSLKSCA